MIGVAVRALASHRGAARGAAVAVVLAAAAAVPQLGSGFYVSLGLSILIFGLLAMSLDLLAGYAGLVSLGHASFLGLGAYGIAYGMGRGLSADQSVALALGVTLVAALCFGLVAVRTRGITFVILTLALGQIIWGLAYRWVSVSGGDNGLPVPARPTLGALSLAQNGAYYYFVLAVFVACALLLWLIVRSPFGLSLRGIRDNEARMLTLGYNVWLHKYVAFVISAFLGGIAGVLFAFYDLYVSPTVLDFPHNGNVVLMAVLGGLGTLWGPLAGATLIILFQQYVSIYVHRWVTLLGVMFVLGVLFAREGLWGAALDAAGRIAARHGAGWGAAPGSAPVGRPEAPGSDLRPHGARR